MKTRLLALLLTFATAVSGLAWGDLGSSGKGRGDNPVVGSLPCIADPRLDDLFWLPNGLPKPPTGFTAGLPPVFGLMSDSAEMEGILFNAAGDPFGYVDQAENWTNLGLVKRARVSLDRNQVGQGNGSFWQFLPKGYLGGTLSVEMGGLTSTYPITTQLYPVSLTEFALSPFNMGRVTYTFSAPPASYSMADVTVDVLLFMGTLNIAYRP